LRDSFYVNGMEPFNQDGTPRFEGAVNFELPEGNFPTKVTVRYYPSSLGVRLLVWAGTVLSLYALFWVTKKIYER
jgi:hypothetical protein